MDSTEKPETTPTGTTGAPEAKAMQNEYLTMNREQLRGVIYAMQAELNGALAAREIAEARVEFATRDQARMMQVMRTVRDLLNGADLGTPRRDFVVREGGGPLVPGSLTGVVPRQDRALLSKFERDTERKPFPSEEQPEVPQPEAHSKNEGFVMFGDEPTPAPPSQAAVRTTDEELG